MTKLSTLAGICSNAVIKCPDFMGFLLKLTADAADPNAMPMPLLTVVSQGALVS